jgi:hypothetical protein
MRRTSHDYLCLGCCNKRCLVYGLVVFLAFSFFSSCDWGMHMHSGLFKVPVGIVLKKTKSSQLC